MLLELIKEVEEFNALVPQSGIRLRIKKLIKEFDEVKKQLVHGDY